MKNLKLTIAIISLMISILNLSVTYASTLLGDVNGDGKVDSGDAILVLKAAVDTITLTPEQKIAADVSGDYSVNAYDAALILKYSAGMIQEFPVQKANHGPKFIDCPKSIVGKPNEMLSFAITAQDEDGDNLTFGYNSEDFLAVAYGESGLSAQYNQEKKLWDVTFHWMPIKEGRNTLKVKVEDGKGGGEGREIIVTIGNDFETGSNEDIYADTDIIYYNASRMPERVEDKYGNLRWSFKYESMGGKDYIFRHDAFGRLVEEKWMSDSFSNLKVRINYGYGGLDNELLWVAKDFHVTNQGQPPSITYTAPLGSIVMLDIEPNWMGRNVFFGFNGVINSYKTIVGKKKLAAAIKSSPDEANIIEERLNNDADNDTYTVIDYKRSENVEYGWVNIQNAGYVLQEVTKEDADTLAGEGKKVIMTRKPDGSYKYEVKKLTEKWIFTEYLPNNDKITYHITDIRDSKGFLLYRRVNEIKKDQDDKEYDAELQKSVFSYDADEFTDGSKLAVYEKDGYGKLLASRIYSLRSFGLLMKKIDYATNKTYTYKWPPRSEKRKYVDSGKPVEVGVYDNYDPDWYDNNKNDNVPIYTLKFNGNYTESIPISDMPEPILGIRNGVVSYSVYYIEEARFLSDKMQYRQEYRPEGVFVEEKDIMNSQIMAWRVFSRDTMKLNKILVNQIAQQGAAFSYKKPIRNAEVAEDCERDFDAGAGASQYRVNDTITSVSYEMVANYPKSGTTKTVQKATQEKPPESNAEIDSWISRLKYFMSIDYTLGAERILLKLKPYINDDRVVLALAEILLTYRSRSLIDSLIASNGAKAASILIIYAYFNPTDRAYVFGKLKTMVTDPVGAARVVIGTLNNRNLGPVQSKEIFLELLKFVNNSAAEKLVKIALISDDNGILKYVLAMPLEVKKSHYILQVMIDAAKDTNRALNERRGAIEIIGVMQDAANVDPIALPMGHAHAEAVEPLTILLTDENEDSMIRSAAAIALGRIGYPDGLTKLNSVLASSNDNLVYEGAIIRGLGYLGISDPQTIKTLEDRLRNTTVPFVRDAIFWTLGKIGTEETIAPLSKLLGGGI